MMMIAENKGYKKILPDSNTKMKKKQHTTQQYTHAI